MSDEPKKSYGRRTISATAQPRELVTDRPRLKGAWTAKIITLVPEAYPGQLGVSLVGRALQDGKWALEPIDLRIFGEGKHRNVDDTPSGGGAGMVLRADVMGRAITYAQRGVNPDRTKWPLVYLSPRGKRLDQAMAARFAACEGITLIAGRFEGLDQRVIDHFEIEEVSLGDFVMTGGDIAAEALIDATVRLRDGVLGNADSTQEESFSDGTLEHPQYTRPASWEGRDIPEVLTSGDHGKVADWRREESNKITRQRRPDLLEKDTHDN
ncbi:MAG: tRNA (guanosine(37)-N1)-methyltransferase TrmD [Paracoccaceae bacterium]